MPISGPAPCTLQLNNALDFVPPAPRRQGVDAMPQTLARSPGRSRPLLDLEKATLFAGVKEPGLRAASAAPINK